MNSDDRNLNLDPLSGASGAHPVGTGVGAVAGGAAGAVATEGPKSPAPSSGRWWRFC